MIVDAHTTVWDSPDQLGPAITARLGRFAQQPWNRPDGSSTAHDDAMQVVDYALVCGVHCQLTGACIGHEQVAAHVAGQPQKLIGFAGIDPLGDDPAQSIDHAVQLGLAGVTLSPAGSGFHPCHSRAMAVYEMCDTRGLPIIVEGGCALGPQSCIEYARPELLDEVARAFPSLRMVMTGIGDPWVDACLVMLEKHEHVYADTSGLTHRPATLGRALQAAHEMRVCNKIFFASGFPWCSPHDAVMNIYAVSTLRPGGVPRRVLSQIVENNTLDKLGINRPEKLRDLTAIEPVEHDDVDAKKPSTEGAVAQRTMMKEGLI